MTDHTLSSETLSFILETAKDIAHEPDIEGLCLTLLRASMQLTKAEGATLYLANSVTQPSTLKHTLVLNSHLELYDNAFISASEFEDIPLFNPAGTKQEDRIASYCFHNQELLNISDPTNTSCNQFIGPTQFDQKYNYHTHSIVCTPLLSTRNNHPIGVIQLVNARSSGGRYRDFTHEQEHALKQFAHFAASSVERQQNIDQQRNLLVQLASESSTDSLLDRILRESKSIANADAGTLYLLNENNGSPYLSFAHMVNDTLEIDTSTAPESLPLQQVPLLFDDGTESLINVASAAVHSKIPISVDDAYDSNLFDFSGTKAFDKEFNYYSQSFLVIPLMNHDDEVIGVLQLINALDPASKKPKPFSKRSLQLTKALANYAAIGLNNQLLVGELKKLLDAFIKCIAEAIDAKSPHTSAHCQRIPLLTELIAKAACDDDGVFKDFSLNKDEWYELNVAAWLHDCGKLATPDTLLDKSTKLHLMSDQIETIKARFACAMREAEMKLARQLLVQPDRHTSLKDTHTSLCNKLQDDLAFLKDVNKGGEYMSPEQQQRVRDIARQEWTDADGNTQPMLTDHEVYNLTIAKGTLTKEERQAINDHMVVTLNMLESLPFPKKLRRVPEYAAGHHEKMDGSGFPRGLTREQLSIPARMMAIADVFEALTASDRPYKPPMKVSQALGIMSKMVEDHHLDPDIFQLFVEKQVWKAYASSELKPEQLDITSAS